MAAFWAISPRQRQAIWKVTDFGANKGYSKRDNLVCSEWALNACRNIITDLEMEGDVTF